LFYTILKNEYYFKSNIHSIKKQGIKLMRKFTHSIVAAFAVSSFAVAGGDIAPVEPVVETPMIEEVSTGSFYAGIAYSWIGTDISGTTFDNSHEPVDLSLDMGAIMLDAGYKFNDYIAVEARYWIGINSDSDIFHDGQDYRPLDTDSDAWGIYAKPMYPVTDTFDIYGLLGYGSATLNDGQTFSADVEGISWGVGAAYSFTENWSVFLDYVAFTEDSLTDNALTDSYDHSFDTLNFGFNYQF
jgi:opacity protein-like surface antigen